MMLAPFMAAVLLTVSGQVPCLSPEQESELIPGAFVGNGRLSAAFDIRGNLVECRWPASSHFSQISRTQPIEASSEPRTPCWGIRLNDQTSWLNDDSWQVEWDLEESPLVSTLWRGVGSLRITQEAFVHPTLDVLVIHLSIAGASEPPAVLWYANFSPVANGDSASAGLVPALRKERGFAVFADPTERAVTHFRPRRPGQGDWDAAGDLLRIKAPAAAWALMGEGTWIMYSPVQEMTAFDCGIEGTPASAWEAAAKGQLRNTPAAIGHTDSAIVIRPDENNGVFEAVVFAAFGASHEGAQNQIARARKAGYQSLKNETLEHWGNWQAGTSRGTTVEENSCLLALVQLMDQETGGIILSPLEDSAYDYPEHSAIAAAALAGAGFPGLAESHLAFLFNALDMASNSQPAGLLAGAYRTDGTAALPSFIIKPETTAMFLWALRNYLDLLPPDDQRSYLIDHGTTIQECALFLVNWMDARTHDPLPSFNPALSRDSVQPGLLPAYLAGIDSAVAMARIAHWPAETWQRRSVEIEARIRKLSEEQNRTFEDSVYLWLLEYSDDAWRETRRQDLQRKLNEGNLQPQGYLELARIIEDPVERTDLKRRIESFIKESRPLNTGNAALLCLAMQATTPHATVNQ